MRKLFVTTVLLVLSLTISAGARNIAPMATAEWLQANMNNAKLVVLDVRRVEEYREGHIPGAINAFYGARALILTDGPDYKDDGVYDGSPMGRLADPSAPPNHEEDDAWMPLKTDRPGGQQPVFKIIDRKEGRICDYERQDDCFFCGFNLHDGSRFRCTGRT